MAIAKSPTAGSSGARGELEDQPRAAVVFGLRRERFPERSIYNRMADIEWNMPMAWGTSDGTAQACGGDAMIRAEAFRSVGGYNPSVPAGEEPELCRRLQRAGWMVVRVDANMTWHDAAMLRFRQWARRQFRTGYGGLDFTTRFGRGGDNPFRSQIRSARIWGLGWPLALLVGAAGAGMLGGPIACSSAAGLIALAPCVQAARIAARNWSRAGGSRGALTYGMLTVVGKGFQMAGQLLYTRDRLVGRHARLIEYNSPRQGPGRRPPYPNSLGKGPFPPPGRGGSSPRPTLASRRVCPMRDPEWQADLRVIPVGPGSRSSRSGLLPSTASGAGTTDGTLARCAGSWNDGIGSPSGSPRR